MTKSEEKKTDLSADAEKCRQHRREKYGTDNDVDFRTLTCSTSYNPCSIGCPVPDRISDKKGTKKEKSKDNGVSTDYKCPECGSFGKTPFLNPDTGKSICGACALKVAPEKWKEDETRKILADLKLCREYRKPLGLPTDHDFTQMECGFGYSCVDNCPVPHRQQYKPQQTLGTPKPKPRTAKQELEHFLMVQQRVIQKLAWNPEIYELLDDLRSDEIIQRLQPKPKVDLIPKQFGGGMKLKASDKTTKMFSDLEKQYAEEDEKKGKAPPPDYEKKDKPNNPFYEWIGDEQDEP